MASNFSLEVGPKGGFVIQQHPCVDQVFPFHLTAFLMRTNTRERVNS